MKARYCTILAIMAMLLATTAASAQSKKTAGKKAVAAVKPQSKDAGMSAKAKALFDDMLPNTQRVFVIDSTIVDKDKVLSAMPLPKAYGQFVEYDKFFGSDTGNHSFVFLNGFGNRCYYTKLGTDSISHLYVCDKLGDSWGKPQPIKEINDNFTMISFPYMSSDGQTLYFSGVSSESGLGQRDIYMAKYDAEEDKFLQPENIGLPFNSTADDFAYVVADADGVAWFASTRRQPEGKACVYAFVPTDTRQNYSAYDIDHKRLLSLANLTRIRETWTTPEKREKAMERLNKLRNSAGQSAGNSNGITFIVNDNVTYTSIEQFKSDNTRSAYNDIDKLYKELNTMLKNLDNLRTQYHNAETAKKATIARQIMQIEQQEIAMRDKIRNSEEQLRRNENKLLNNN